MEKEKKQFACVHYFYKIPNSKEGWDFIKAIRKFINKDRYKVRILGRGSKDRSKFWTGIAQAMAQQWGNE